MTWILERAQVPLTALHGANRVAYVPDSRIASLYRLLADRKIVPSRVRIRTRPAILLGESVPRIVHSNNEPCSVEHGNVCRECIDDVVDQVWIQPPQVATLLEILELAS